MSNRTILITGATGKVGRVLVDHLLDAGDYVLATGRSKNRLDKLVAESAEYSERLSTLHVDLLAPNIGEVMLDKLKGLGKFPDGLVNNARDRAYLKTGNHGLVSRGQFVNELTLGVVVPYELTMALALADDSKLGSVVNIGSQYGIVAINPQLYSDQEHESPTHYGVAKAALGQLTRELAVRLSGRGIRVNCVAFGGVEGRVDDAFRQRYAELCPLGRMLKEEELPGPVDFLLSSAGSGITGHVLLVDGGWTAW